MGHSKTDSVVYLDPSLNTSNLGDAIIRLAVEHWFLEPLERAGRQVHRLPLTRSLDHDERELLRAAEDIVLGGTNRLSACTVFDPVPRSPAQYQVSWIVMSDVGTSISRMSGWCSPSRNTSPPIKTHCAWRTPLDHAHLPLRR